MSNLRTLPDVTSTTRINIEMDSRLHEAMRELARRKRVRISLVYDEAVSMYLAKLENHINKKTSELVRKRVS